MKARKKNQYTVQYELDEESGWWAVSVREEPGCFTQGKTLTQCRERIREALSLSVDDAYEAELIDEIVVPKEIKSILLAVEKKQSELKEFQVETKKITAKAAVTLNKKFHCGMRDIGELMGLSHQRIAQLTKSFQD